MSPFRLLWNQPIGANPEIDPESEKLLGFVARQHDRGLWVNLVGYTIPIYEVNAKTPKRKVHRFLYPGQAFVVKYGVGVYGPDHPMGHGQAFAEDALAGLVPIPDEALPDPESDGHIALVDWDSGWVWDMWLARRRDDGDWISATGMKYRVDGSGVFDRSEFAIRNGESIHLYGPSRAAGVPEIAGTIMHHEIVAGRIEHKLAFATQSAAFGRFVSPPACWTDGGWRNGLPEGATIQLDPQLDLSSLNLTQGGMIVARTLQEYGAVCVDVSGGHCLYGEGLYGDPKGRTWDGLLQSDDVIKLHLHHYRVLKMENVIQGGMGGRDPDGIFSGKE